MKVGQTTQLTVAYYPSNATHKEEVIWESSKPEMATVVDGKVTAHKQGYTEITATTKSGKFTSRGVWITVE